MLTSWTGWYLPHVRRIWIAAYFVGGIVALVLGAGAWSVLIAVAVAGAVVLPLEVWARYRHEPPIRQDLSSNP